MEKKENINEELEELRENIDKIDDSLIELLNKRAGLVIEIGKIKKKHNLEIYQPPRERAILNHVREKSSTLGATDMESIWKEIMGACKNIQGYTPKIGYLGPIGTFTHQAALNFFPKSSSEFISLNSIQEIFDSIQKDKISFGLVPIENSLYGTVRETLDLLIERDLVIFGELELRVVQNLITLKNATLDNIINVYSHPQAFAQCKMWLKSNIPNVNLINVNSTAEAIRIIKIQNNPSNAAIGTELACNLFKLHILRSNIEDNTNNYTRFIILTKSSKNDEVNRESAKSSILFVTKHIPGALYNVLKCFAEQKVNLLKIESRPRRKGKWEYIFLMDFQGSVKDENIVRALKCLNDNVIWHKVLGTYPVN